MEYIYAVLLLHSAGKEINEQNLKNVLEAAGVQVDESKIKSLISALEGLDINKIIEEAKQITAAPTVTTEQKEEKPKEEEKKEEKKEEEALGGLSALFGF